MSQRKRVDILAQKHILFTIFFEVIKLQIPCEELADPAQGTVPLVNAHPLLSIQIGALGGGGVYKVVYGTSGQTES